MTAPSDEFSVAVKAAGERFALAWLELAKEVARHQGAKEPVDHSRLAPAPVVVSRPDLETPWLTAREVVSRARCHVDTVRRALESGELHGHQRVRKGRWQIKPAAVDAWIDGRDGSIACGCTELKRPSGSRS